MIVIVVVQNDGEVEVGIFVGVLVNVDVGVKVEVAVGVGVAEAVGVSVGVDDVAVAVKVCEDVAEAVAVTVAVLVEVGEGVAEAVAVEVDVAVSVAVGFGVEVAAGSGLGVEVGGGGKYTNVLVGLGEARAVFVAIPVFVGSAVCVATNVPAVEVGKDVRAVAGGCVTAEENEAPGVRTTSIQAGLVRMAGSTGSMNPLGRRVKKSLFGSSRDSTLASSSQRGVKRSAHPPARRIHKSPNRRMRAMTDQSRFSFSIAFMDKPVQRQAHINRSSGTHLFIMTGTIDPDTPVMCVDNATRDGKPQPGTTTFEFGLAR